jgi:uncharacterized protein YndB with AHSA1/START domain
MDMASLLRDTAVETAPAALLLTRDFTAPRALVWLAWADCVHLSRWWGPEDMASAGCDVDPRPGGTLRVALRAPDGTIYPTLGEFREVVPNERLVLTQDWSQHPPDWQDLLERLHEGPPPASREALLTLSFEEDDGRSTQHWRMDFASDAQRDALLAMGLVDGWTRSFERLARLLATLAPTS